MEALLYDPPESPQGAQVKANDPRSFSLQTSRCFTELGRSWLTAIFPTINNAVMNWAVRKSI